jgi:hypothetical protein
MMSTSAAPQLDTIDDLIKHNVSQDNWNDFLHMLKEFKKNATKLEKWANETLGDNCTHYCAHHIRDLITSYQCYHGYVTLIVSTRACVGLGCESTHLPLLSDTAVEIKAKFLAVSEERNMVSSFWQRSMENRHICVVSAQSSLHFGLSNPLSSFSLSVDLHIWHDSEHPQHHHSDPKGNVQNTN